MTKWSITLEVKINEKKERIGPIQLKQGILQGDSFCVRLFTLCLNPIAWWLRSIEGYTYSHNKQEKLTHFLYVDDLKTYHNSAQKALLITKTAKSMFEDIIGLYWGLDKCAKINIVRGKLHINEENVSITDTEELKILDIDDHYKFFGKYENSVQLEQQVCNEATSEYLKRVDNRLDSNPTERHRQTNKRDSQKGWRNAPPRIHQTTLPTRGTRGKWHEKRRRHLQVDNNQNG